jgi:D-beta-D-heptose 7-phosphate kinase/D-beta-D-heptose 1-phosphate adenosyltransferase
MELPGCFDLLHPGHLSSLERARDLGDFLVVGLNSDASVHRLKGPGPILTATERVTLLAGLRSVDYVVVFAEDTPAQLIGALLPDVLVKGADWEPGETVGKQAVEAAGGRVVTLPPVPGLSTTALLARIRGTRSGVASAEEPE